MAQSLRTTPALVDADMAGKEVLHGFALDPGLPGQGARRRSKQRASRAFGICRKKFLVK